MANRVLITGASGFVGSNLARRSVERGDEVTLGVPPESDRWRLREVQNEAGVLEADLRDGEAVERLVAEARPELVMHLATHGAYSWQEDSERIFETTVLGTLNLLSACEAAGVRRLVNAGSSSEYGYKDHPPAEDELPEPNSDYAAAKVAATTWCGYFARERGVETVTLRLYSIYGPWEDPKRLIPTIVREALAGGLPPLVGPDVARDFVFVDDACSAFLSSADAPEVAPGAVYNVASGRQTTIRDVVETVRDTFGVDAEPDWGSMPERAWDTTSWVGDPAKIERELGWRAETDLADGLRKTAGWIESGGMPDAG
jgi:nucleoside-diphosphate-sugar epimerase